MFWRGRPWSSRVWVRDSTCSSWMSKRKSWGSLLSGSFKLISDSKLYWNWGMRLSRRTPSPSARRLVIELFRFRESDRLASRIGRGEFRKSRSIPDKPNEPRANTIRPLAAKVRKNKLPSFHESAWVMQSSQKRRSPGISQARDLKVEVLSGCIDSLNSSEGFSRRNLRRVGRARR